MNLFRLYRKLEKLLLLTSDLVLEAEFNATELSTPNSSDQTNSLEL